MLRPRGRQVVSDTLYVEDVFSAFTYTGTGAALSIVNGIDLAGKGGLVWLKNRGAIASHYLMDTVRGTGVHLRTDATSANASSSAMVTSYDASGFTLGTTAVINTASNTYVGWSFRKAPKFFDVVTYTGTGVARTIAHSLGVAPGMIIVKRTDTTSNWTVYHRSIANTDHLIMNSTAATAAAATSWNSTSATATEFSIGTAAGVNTSGGTFVAYLFAHDTTSDGIIQCGTFTTDGAGLTSVSLEWEPQFLLVKPTSTTGNWELIDTARAWNLSSASDAVLRANTTDAEVTGANRGNPTATGFSLSGLGVSTTHVYMAIRKGLMRPPTDATKVFTPEASTGTSATRIISGLGITTGPDLVINKARSAANDYNWQDRTNGTAIQLTSDSSAAALTETDRIASFNMNGITIAGPDITLNQSTITYINYFFKQARGFFDIVNYTGTGVVKTETHNLGVAPELMFIKSKSNAQAWAVYFGDPTDYLVLDTTAAQVDSNLYWNDTAPTSSAFTVGTANPVNGNSFTYVAYLFATLPGVSKIGTFTGSGTTPQFIECGFASGARFVMIKRLDVANSWMAFDTARGINAGNDPWIRLENLVAESNTDLIDAYAGGFEMNTDSAFVNFLGSPYLYLAIA